MRRAAAVLATAVLSTGLAVSGAAAASAAVGGEEDLDYAGETTPPGEALPETSDDDDDAQAADTARTLPFTGGELVMLVSAGAGAVGAGGALLVATRRRKPSDA